MTKEQFKEAVQNTRELLRAQMAEATGTTGVVFSEARNTDDPTSLPHFFFMLKTCEQLIDEGRVEKANRWLGFVQGAMAAQNLATLDQLKRANMPKGEEFDAERV